MSVMKAYEAVVAIGYKNTFFRAGTPPSPSAISEHLASAGEAAVIKMKPSATTTPKLSAVGQRVLMLLSSVDALGFDESFSTKVELLF